MTRFDQIHFVVLGCWEAMWFIINVNK